ncbi:MAG TPA: hypothetical protein VK796_12530, partial [Cytophaga sp.]|nr:hypothetical protein [Cytophaga sp.]
KNEYDNKNWYIWSNQFDAMDTTLIEVYFIVNTNETDITKGYNRDHANGFIYVLESGATWKHPIVKGEIRIRLMNDLELDNLHGISPDSIFKVNDKILITHFSNLTPTQANNIIITYADRDESFNFSKVISNTDALYRSVDAFADLVIEEDQFEVYTFDDPFEVHAWFGGLLAGLFMLFVMAGIPLLGIGLIVFIIVKYW